MFDVNNIYIAIPLRYIYEKNSKMVPNIQITQGSMEDKKVISHDECNNERNR
ncbi:hypothetical protein [Saccharolobus sp.]|uniref:hypothetical protein n=1 Tax=Saccharolobus sp. TaxID=2100761 RepID=UPI0031815FFF